MEKENSEKSTPKNGASEKKTSTTPKKSATPKASTRSKTPSKTVQTPKAKTVSKAGTKKTTKAAKPRAGTQKSKAPAQGKKVDEKSLLFRKFDSWQPDELFRPKAAPKPPQNQMSPPFVSADNEAEMTRIRGLLFKKFDLETTSAGREPGVETPPPPPASPSVMPKGSDPMGTTIKFVLIGFVLIMALVVKVSATNHANYYIKPTKTGVEIWRGIFAPMGQQRLINLENAEIPESARPSYSKEEIYPFIFTHYIKQADVLLEKPGMPDFEGIKSYLNQSMPYAMTEKDRRLATARLNNIDQMIFLIKADVAASKETLADYDAALEYLRQAQALDVDGSKSVLIKEKVDAVESARAALEKESEQKEKTAEEAAPTAK
jgi:hypothetical protein